MFTIFQPFAELFVAFTQKADGNMRVRSSESIANRKQYANKMGLAYVDLVAVKLDADSRVKKVQLSDKGTTLQGYDALVTQEKSIFITITAADCLPIYLYDPKLKVVGLVHAGWRGLAKGIVKNTINTFTNSFSSKPEDILVGIGPAIGQCHFEVGQEVVAAFEDIIKIKPEAVVAAEGGKYFLDLKLIATMQLCQLGMKHSNIEINHECTSCEKEKYFSFRRDKPETVQAMMAVIGITN